MGYKSLLELLREEEKEIKKIRAAEEGAKDFREKIGDAAWNEDSCKRLAAAYEETAREYEENLAIIRKEIKEYLDLLSSL